MSLALEHPLPSKGVDFSLGEWQNWKGLCGQSVVTVRRTRPQACRRKNFYVVLAGKRTGLFYRWYDVQMAIAGHPDPVFKGFDTLAGAARAVELGRWEA